MPQEQGIAVLSLLGGIFLFVLVLVLAWLCTRWLASRYGTKGAGGKIQVLERTTIGPDRTLLVVRVDDQAWLLGVTPHSITGIGEVDLQQFVEGMDPETESTGPVSAVFSGAQDFSKTLQEALKGWIPGRKQEKDKPHE